MKRKSYKPATALQVRTSFPLREICGTWESLCGSPSIRIYHDDSRFRLVFEYNPDTAFTVLLIQCWGYTFFNFYGMIRIAYDDERDMLLLTTEGEYRRVYD